MNEYKKQVFHSKCDKEISRELSEDETFKECSTPIYIREMHIKTTLSTILHC